MKTFKKILTILFTLPLISGCDFNSLIDKAKNIGKSKEELVKPYVNVFNNLDILEEYLESYLKIDFSYVESDGTNKPHFVSEKSTKATAAISGLKSEESEKYESIINLDIDYWNYSIAYKFEDFHNFYGLKGKKNLYSDFFYLICREERFTKSTQESEIFTSPMEQFYVIYDEDDDKAYIGREQNHYYTYEVVSKEEAILHCDIFYSDEVYEDPNTVWYKGTCQICGDICYTISMNKDQEIITTELGDESEYYCLSVKYMEDIHGTRGYVTIRKLFSQENLIPGIENLIEFLGDNESKSISYQFGSVVINYLYSYSNETKTEIGETIEIRINDKVIDQIYNVFKLDL